MKTIIRTEHALHQWTLYQGIAVKGELLYRGQIALDPATGQMFRHNDCRTDEQICKKSEGDSGRRLYGFARVVKTTVFLKI